MKKILQTVILVLLVLPLAACGTPDFYGSRLGNDTQLIMEYRMLNRTETQMLKLTEGDVIDAKIISQSGKLSVTLQKEGAAPLYKNDTMFTRSFQITVKESGTYKLTVKGKKAKGSLRFVKKNRPGGTAATLVNPRTAWVRKPVNLNFSMD